MSKLVASKLLGRRVQGLHVVPRVVGSVPPEGTNRHGVPEISGGSNFTKPGTSTCHDFNPWSGRVGTSHEGWLSYGNGNWGGCNAGYVKYTGGSIVLCANVAAPSRRAERPASRNIPVRRSCGGS